MTVPNNIQTRAPLRSTPSAHEAMFAPSVSHAVVRGVSVAPFRAGSSRHRPRPARHVARPVRSASSSAAENENSEEHRCVERRDARRARLPRRGAQRQRRSRPRGRAHGPARVVGGSIRLDRRCRRARAVAGGRPSEERHHVGRCQPDRQGRSHRRRESRVRRRVALIRRG